MQFHIFTINTVNICTPLRSTTNINQSINDFISLTNLVDFIDPTSYAL